MVRARLTLALFLSFAGAVRPAGAADDVPTLSAAISLKEALTDVARAYEKQTGRRVRLNFGATGQLLAQIRDGAPVDGFASASAAQMKRAVEWKLVEPSAAVTFARNRLVLIVPADGESAVTDFQSLAGPSVKRLSIGQPKTVPAGEYAAQVLERLRLNSALRDRIVYGANVRQVLDYVQRGEVDAGIVYATDAKQAGGRVKVIATVDEAWHDPILYSLAPVMNANRQQEVVAFQSFVTSDAAQAILVTYGFDPPGRAATATAATTTTTTETSRGAGPSPGRDITDRATPGPGTGRLPGASTATAAATAATAPAAATAAATAPAAAGR
jgi:molybdate transport system substrate-binding protein